jgi:hypothetical protein
MYQTWRIWHLSSSVTCAGEYEEASLPRPSRPPSPKPNLEQQQIKKSIQYFSTDLHQLTCIQHVCPLKRLCACLQLK